MSIPSYKEMQHDLIKLAKYIRENINKHTDKTVSGWLFDIYEEGYFEGIRDYDKDDIRARNTKSN